MTQGEILSALAPIDSLVGILNRMKGKEISTSEVNMTMPFINRAQKAAEKISRFALDNFNSIDANKRELANVICHRFNSLLIEFNGIKKLSSRSIYNHAPTEYFNNHIQSIKVIIFNTIEACEQLKDVLPPPDDNIGNKRSSGDNATVVNHYIVEKLTINSQNEGPAKTEIVDNNQEDKEEYEDGDEEEYEDDDREVIPELFDKRINVEKVIEKIKDLNSEKVEGKRRWYVIYRVLRFLQWIGRSQTDFISWVKSHFAWEGGEEFRGVQSEFINSEPNKWNILTIKNKNGNKNKTIGPDYYDFAVSIRDAFVEVDTSGEMHDKDTFLIHPKQGGINHKNKWK